MAQNTVGKRRWPHIVVGGRCNNNCQFCVANSQWEPRPIRELIGAVGAAVRDGAQGFHITGGELTTHPELHSFLRFVRSTRLPWSVATNARIFAVEGNVRTFRKAGLVRATVSLHGDKATHNWLTGTDSYDQTIAGIHNLEDAGVRIDLGLVATTRLLERVSPKAFAALALRLSVSRVIVRPPANSPATRGPEHRPGLGDLVAWLDNLAPRLARNHIALETSKIPRCALAIDHGRVQPPEASRLAAPCRSCRLAQECTTFVPEEWAPGDIDFLLPRSPEAPGHLHYAPGRPLKPFDLAVCPYRSGDRRLPCSHDGFILTTANHPPVLWKLDPPGLAEPVLLHAKVHHGQVWHAMADGTVAPLYLAPECASCHRLHECPAVFSARNGARVPIDTLPTADAELESEDLTEIIDLAFDGDTTIQAVVREVWLVERGATRPRRPFPRDPVRLLGELRRNGVVPKAYSLPTAEDRRPFRAVLTAKERCDDRFVTMHHEGVSLQITESCMCRCVMCNIVGYFKTPMMPLHRVLRTLEECGLLGIRLADLFGGEVTLRKDLFELLAHVRWLGMDAMFITTGYYLTPAYARKLSEVGVKRVVISIDGSRPEIHDEIRQLPGIYDRAVRAMKVMAGVPEIETFASTVILAENLWDLPDLIKLSGRIGLTKHEFFLPISGPVSSTLPRWPDAEQMTAFFDEILPRMEKAARRLGVAIDFRPEIRGWEFERAEAAEMVGQGLYNIHARRPESRCQAPGHNLFITVNGNVYPCDMPSVIHKDRALGNLEGANLLAIVTSPAMHTFAQEAGHYPACQMCVGRYEAVR